MIVWQMDLMTTNMNGIQIRGIRYDEDELDIELWVFECHEKGQHCEPPGEYSWEVHEREDTITYYRKVGSIFDYDAIPFATMLLNNLITSRGNE